MMIHHHDVGGERLAPRLHHEAFFVRTTFAAETVFACRRHERPNGRTLGHRLAIGAVAGQAALGKRRNALDVLDVLARSEAAFGARALEVVMTDVIAAPLQKRCFDR